MVDKIYEKSEEKEKNVKWVKVEDDNKNRIYTNKKLKLETIE